MSNDNRDKFEFSDRGKAWCFIIIFCLAVWISVFALIANAATREEIALFAMQEVFKCHVLPLPEPLYTYEVSKYPRGIGAYFPLRRELWLSPSLKGGERENEYLAHEYTHHIQAACGMSQNETQAYAVQAEWSKEHD